MLVTAIFSITLLEVVMEAFSTFLMQIMSGYIIIPSQSFITVFKAMEISYMHRLSILSNLLSWII